ncbi:MAG: hypothetical protein KC535_00495 [Nanoarchaeota archaeon]|nr:hypothetical protein [Nanoarchaeota archaeon]
MPIETIIGIALGLMILGLGMYFLFFGGRGAQSLSKCDSLGGVLIQTQCDLSVTNHLSIGDDGKGNVCCKQKLTVSDAAYNNWLEQAPKVETTTTEKSETSLTGTTSRITLDSVKKNNILLTFNGDKFENTLLEAGENGEVVVTASHNFENGAYCHLYITEAEAAGTGWKAKPQSDGSIASLAGFSLKSAACSPDKEGLLQLEIDDKITVAGIYKADFIVKESETGTTLGSATTVFEVKKDTTDTVEEGTPRTTTPTVSITLSQNYRKQQTYCWVNINVIDYGEPLDKPYQLFINKTNNCNLATFSQEVPSVEELPLSSGEHLCIQVEQPYNDVVGIERTKKELRDYDASQCDVITIYNQERKSSQCDITCEELNPDACNDFTQRTDACEFGINCYQNKKTGACETCTSSQVDSCADYKTEGTCKENDCLATDCTWKDTWWSDGKCVPAKI